MRPTVNCIYSYIYLLHIYIIYIRKKNYITFCFVRHNIFLHKVMSFPLSLASSHVRFINSLNLFLLVSYVVRRHICMGDFC